MATLYAAGFIGTTISAGGMAALDAGYMEIRDGNAPVNITDAATGSVLARCDFDTPGAFFVNSGGILAMLFPPARVNGLVSGTPTYARVFKNDGTIYIQFDIGIGVGADAGKPGAINAPVVAGQRVQLDALVLRDTSNAISAATTLICEISSGGTLAGGMSELPRQYIDTTAPIQTGTVRRFGPGEAYASPIAAYNAANWGDRIVGQAGFDYNPGAYTEYYAPKTADTAPTHRWITIEADTVGTPEGVRMSPAACAASNAWKFRLTNTSAAIQFTTGGTHHIRFIGFEVLPTDTLTFAYFMFWAGPNSGTGLQGSVYADLPHHIVWDRMYCHGSDTCEVNHGLALMGDFMAVVDSYLGNFHYSDGDCQAICAWAGKGPYKVNNNFIEGLGENIMWGGSESIYNRVVPSDIEFRYNTVSKNPAWYGAGYLYRGTKTLLELKCGIRVLIEGNVFENNWEAGAAWFGPSITMKSANQTGDNTKGYWRTSDVTIINNVIRRSANLLNWSPAPGDNNTPMARLYVNNLLGYEMDYYKGNKWDMSDPVNYKNRTYICAMSPSHDAIIEHVTAVFPDLNGQLISCGSPSNLKARRVTLRNIVLAGGANYPVGGDSYGYTDEAFAAFFAATSDIDHVVADVGITEPGAGNTAYPVVLGAPKNHWNHNTTDASFPYIGFNDLPNKDFSLAGSSIHKGYSTDGKDPGAVLSEMTTVLALAGLNEPAPNRARLGHRRFRMQ